MPLPPERTFDPVPPVEGTKYDPDTVPAQDGNLGSYAYWAIFDTDRTRRVVGWVHTNRPDKIATEFPGYDAYLIHRSFLEAQPVDRGVILYIDYDWTLGTEPVNQWAFVNPWRAHVATFAHSFDALPGFESFNQLPAASKVTAFQVGQTIGGHAWERLAFWLTYDAALSEDWLLPIVMDPVKKAVDAVCIECQSVSAARRLALNINATTFAAKLAAGRIHGTNRTATPWEPGDLLTIVPESSEDVTVQTAIAAHVAAFNAARDHYDAHVAHEVIAHEHA